MNEKEFGRKLLCSHQSRPDAVRLMYFSRDHRSRQTDVTADAGIQCDKANILVTAIKETLL
jgi:hypothetical protein